MAGKRKIKTSRVALLAKKAATSNFTDPDGPSFEASRAKHQAGYSGSLKVISWNIMFSQEIETAIDELGSQPDLAGADIILLQEMDEAGVDAIAAALELNYIYYPASVHSRTGRMFGNAVLARWPIVGKRKLLLPHLSPRTGEVRLATQAHIKIDDHDVLTYSVHTETYALGTEKRHSQFRALVDDIEKETHHHVLVGGDFNTLTARNLSRLDQRFTRVDLIRSLPCDKGTIKPRALCIDTDHIFTRGFVGIDGGVFARTKASDHFPVWQRLSLDSCEE